MSRRLPLLAIEIAVVAALFAGDALGLVPLSKVPFLIALAWISLRVRHLRWRDVGFSWPAGRARALIIGCLAGAGLATLEVFVTHPGLSRLLGEPDLSDFESIEDDLALLAVLLVLVWPIAAFGEELVYRGYMMNRVADLTGRTRGGWAASLSAASLLFGLAHLDQGLPGQLEAAIMGLLYGLLYLANNRNLVVPIVAHGVQDTIDLILIYFGLYPGM
jgi:membrane protease YdiL (CAAX protease family)